MLPHCVFNRGRAALRMLPLIGMLGLAACATRPPTLAADQPFDPYEQGNRKMHAFNVELDKALVRPVAEGYAAVVPDDIETSIGHFATNLALPRDVVNNMLQLNMRAAIQDTARFVVNTTVGLGGFFDPATEMGMPPKSDSDFGKTLYTWGTPQGAYIELPVLGPSSTRATAGIVVDIFTNPLNYVINRPYNYYSNAASVASALTRRNRLSSTIDAILYQSADSYAAARSLYLQNRQFKLSGSSSATGYLDPYNDPYATPTAKETSQ